MKQDLSVVRNEQSEIFPDVVVGTKENNVNLNGAADIMKPSEEATVAV